MTMGDYGGSRDFDTADKKVERTMRVVMPRRQAVRIALSNK